MKGSVFYILNFAAETNRKHQILAQLIECRHKSLHTITQEKQHTDD